MEIASVLPLIGVFIAAIVYFLHMEILQMISPVPPAEAPERAADPISEEHRSNSVLSRYTKKYGTALWILWYIACGGIWQLLAGVLANGCINADTDGVFPQTDYHVML